MRPLTSGSERDDALDHVEIRALAHPRCHLGEGPTYDPARDTAWWFDILGKALYEAPLSSGQVRRHDLPVMASALAFVDDDRQLLVAEDGLYLRDWKDGRLELHRRLPPSASAVRSNDARVHPCGTLWFSTMGLKAEPEAGAIHAYRQGEIRTLFPKITVPNAICFSPDGGTGYFADTRQKRLQTVKLDPQSGLPIGEPETLVAYDGPGGLDGAVTDADGSIWCALWGAGAVIAFSPQGEVQRRIAVPARQPSCPAFVGPAFGSMLVTSAYEGMDEAARADDPQHGLCFILDAGFRGKPEPRIRL
jgi:sugar lactone lactonase